ncbi:MAG: NAD(P)-dependent oxidoreductase [Alphaproteobacteria bacterium]|nr:NAD(P)-dependent oxidoreductase [Alphaproteobacteria bacterium]MCZ6844474.1 NAD(P)-dependent oxidoreductase [Alphaproteobacteria bacterium]
MNDSVGLPVGIVGLGNAGSALASAFSGQRPLIGYDANPARREAVAALDLQWAGSAEEVAGLADTVVLSLPKPEASKAVVGELLGGATPPKLIVETSTITPNTARDLGAICAAASVEFIDAAVGSGVQAMAAGQVTFLVGGTDAAVAQARPVLELVAKTIHHLGPVGAGSGAKVVNNAVMHALMVVLIEAGAMAGKLGIPMTALVDILGSADGVSRPLQHRFRERILNGDYTGGMSVANARKDSLLALETAADCGVPLFAMLAAHTPYEIAASQGMGDLDYAALAKLWEAWCDMDFSSG